MLSEISWMEFLSVTAVLLLFYYLWILFSFYRVQKKGNLRKDGESLGSESWHYPQPAYYVAQEPTDTYQLDKNPTELDSGIAEFAAQYTHYLNSFADAAINVAELRQKLIILLQADQRLHAAAEREQVKEIIVEQGALKGLNLREDLDLDALWEALL